MNLYECPRIEDAAGYVLRALPVGEWESYGYHVGECEECAEKVSELAFASHALLSAVPQLSAPSDIRNRVMSVVGAQSELLQAAGAGADRPASQSSRRRAFGFARLHPLAAGALATVLLALALGAGTLLRGGPDSSCTTRAATVDGAAGPGAKAQLRICDGDARLAIDGVPLPPDGRIYQLWLDDPNDRLGAKPTKNVFSVRDGSASVDVGALKRGTTVLVTDEPLPNGSEIPTRTPLVKVVT